MSRQLIIVALVAVGDQGCAEEGGSTNPCEAVTCSGYGRCVVEGGQPRCECEAAYQAVGLTCVANCLGVSCSDRGGCIVVENEPQCVCDQGYWANGPECLPDPPRSCAGQECSGHGVCVEVDHKPAFCICEFGWQPFGLVCVPANCQGKNCSGHGACVDDDGAPWCRCDPGYRTVGLGCVPADCSLTDCSGHGACVEEGGQARCVCDHGHVAVGLECRPEACAGEECSGHGACVDAQGTLRCLCDPGYVADGLACRPGCVGLDCGLHGACIQSGGEVACLCDPGYEPAGQSCVAIDTGGVDGTPPVGYLDGSIGDGESGTDLGGGDSALGGDASGPADGAPANDASVPGSDGDVVPGPGGGGGGCFPAGTLVRMADHSSKPIENVVVGDRVMALDTLSGNLVAGRVVHLSPVVSRNSLRALSFDTGDSLIVIETTHDHPFFVDDEYLSVTAAEDLVVGDAFFFWVADGIVRAILRRSEEIAVQAEVFNFEVEPYHCYFANDVLVHNEKINCFAEGTAVTLGTGESRPIEHVRAGDEVLTIDPHTGALIERNVIGVRVFQDRPAVMIVVATDQGWVTIRAGRTHLFFQADLDTPVAAHRLASGDQLLMRQGDQLIEATVLWVEAYRERGALYDLEIEDSDSYFAEGILVRDAP